MARPRIITPTGGTVMSLSEYFTSAQNQGRQANRQDWRLKHRKGEGYRVYSRTAGKGAYYRVRAFTPRNVPASSKNYRIYEDAEFPLSFDVPNPANSYDGKSHPQNVKRVEYNWDRLLMRVTFVKYGTVVIYDHVPRSIYMELKKLADQGDSCGKMFWTIVRGRNMGLQGSMYPYWYQDHGTHERRTISAQATTKITDFVKERQHEKETESGHITMFEPLTELSARFSQLSKLQNAGLLPKATLGNYSRIRDKGDKENFYKRMLTQAKKEFDRREVV